MSDTQQTEPQAPTPIVDAAAKRIGDLAAQWKIGEISAITFASAASFALLPVNDLERELAEMQATFDLMHAAELRAIKQWQDAHPGNDLVWPDKCKLTIWLLEQLDSARAQSTRDAEQIASLKAYLAEARKSDALIHRIQSALGTDETGDALVEVAMFAHQAEMALASRLRKEREE